MLSGKDRSKKGKVLVVFPSENKIVVEGLNMIKKAVRARQQGQKGQVITKERPVSAASVALICGSCGKATRLGYQVDGENKTRICKKCRAAV